jgi:DNA mismatch endonuclease, patch repair protein
LARNVERDAINRASLEKEGWRVLVIWECETRKLDVLASSISQFLQRA